MANLQRSTLACVLAAATAAIAACDEPATATGLHPEGPPMLQQVFMWEMAPDATNTLRPRAILAFGTHANVVDSFEVPNTQNGSAANQSFRFVFDELLRGNALEEIECRNTREITAGVFCRVPGDYSRVPVGATPDDIADCAVPNDLLDASCGGRYATCLNADGVACGVKDLDENGSADNVRMIAGQVRLMCGAIDVPLDMQESYWQPAGNQLVPSGLTAGGSLGPALIVKPVGGLMPTSSDCTLALAPDVTDKDDLQPCAPAGGDIDAGCTPGDMSAFTFKTEPIRMTSSAPEAGTTGVARNPATITTYWGVPLDPTSVVAGAATVMAGTTDVTSSFTIALNGMSQVQLTSATDFAASTTYTVTISGVRDTFNQPMAAPVSFTFTTVN